MNRQIFLEGNNMKLYSPQGQQYYTAVDNNNKKEGKNNND